MPLQCCNCMIVFSQVPCTMKTNPQTAVVWHFTLQRSAFVIWRVAKSVTRNPVRKGLVELHTVQLLHFKIQRKKNYSTCNESQEWDQRWHDEQVHPMGMSSSPQGVGEAHRCVINIQSAQEWALCSTESQVQWVNDHLLNGITININATIYSYLE